MYSGLDTLGQVGYCTDRYEIKAPGRVDRRPPSRLRRRPSSRPGPEGLLAQRLRGRVAPGSDPGHGHQPPEPLRRLRQQGSAVPQSARSLRRWAGSLCPRGSRGTDGARRRRGAAARGRRPAELSAEPARLRPIPSGASWPRAARRARRRSGGVSSGRYRAATFRPTPTPTISLDTSRRSCTEWPCRQRAARAGRNCYGSRKWPYELGRLAVPRGSLFMPVPG